MKQEHIDGNMKTWENENGKSQEEDIMTNYEFVQNLFGNCRETAEPIDIETARLDLRNFRREAEAAPECWEVPEDLTPEEYMTIWNELCGQGEKTEAEELAEKMRESDIWDPEDCEQLCSLAGLDREYQEADGDNFEQVVFKAAEILGVEIL